MKAYSELERRFARKASVEDAIGILDWDTRTMMPQGSGDRRAEQLATLEVITHEMLTDPRVGDLLDRAETDEAMHLDDWRRSNLREMRRQHAHATAVPAALVEANSKAASRCELAWRQARADNDFRGLLPYLTEVLDRQREIAAIKADRFGCSLYDALLDTYEPGGSVAVIDPLFQDLAEFLPDFLGRVLDRQASEPPVLPLEGPFAPESQKAVGLRLMSAVGFDFSRGRLDVSLHPFCGGATDDVRLTTRYDDADFTTALMGVLHETGHAMYELGRPAAWQGQPVGQARGMAMHESQSLIVEMQACRSREFLTFAAPILRQAFGGDGDAWEVDNLYRLYTRVAPGFIRVDADEVTYPAHVILRYRLEKAMIAGDLALNDLPGAWNDGMRAFFGIVPPDDRLGCLQDIHWPSGAWGYFPTYTLGAMIAAQLFEAARADDPTVSAGIGQGDFSALMAWLGRNIHGKGSLRSTENLVREATGRPLDAGIYKRHLERRYLS